MNLKIIMQMSEVNKKRSIMYGSTHNKKILKSTNYRKRKQIGDCLEIGRMRNYQKNQGNFEHDGAVYYLILVMISQVYSTCQNS